MKRFCIFIFLLMGTLAMQAQISIKLIDSENNTAITDAFIYNLQRTKTTTSGQNGKVLLTEFSLDDTVYIQHASYTPILLAIKDIKQKDAEIRMKRNLIPLSQIVISANKWEQDRSEVPNKIATITQSEIAFENPQTAADLIGETNEVFIQKSQMGGGSPMIRGFSANSVLIVVDGVRMNNAMFRSGNLQNIINIDPNTISNAEVIFGPGSVIYGSDALGGVMDFHTIGIQLSDEGSYFKSNFMGRYASTNMERTFHFDATYAGKKWGGLSSITYSGFSDLRMGNNGRDSYERTDYQDFIDGKDTTIVNSNPNIQKFSGYEQLNLLQKVRFRPNKNLDFSYTFQFSSTTDIPRYDRLIQKSDGNLKYGDWYYGPQKWMYHKFTTDIKKGTALYSSARINLAYQYFEESRHDRKYGKSNLRSRTEKLDLFTLNIDFEKKLSSHFNLFYGIDGAYNNIRSEGLEMDIYSGETTATATRYPDSTNHYGTAAAYGSLKFRPSKKITLLAGIRYSYVSMLSRFKKHTFYDFPFEDISLNTGALNGSLGLVYSPVESWQINTNLSSGFRAPNLDDIAKIFDSEPGNVIVPNKDLKPEYAYNADLRFLKKIGENSEVSLSFFYTWIKDVMVRRDYTFNGMDSIMYDGELSKVQALVNGGSGYIYGGSFSAKANINAHFSLKSFLTYQYGRDEDELPLRHVSPLFGSTALMYTYKKITAEIYANYNGEISYDNLALSERDKPYMYAEDENGQPFAPAWATLNAKAEYAFTNELSVSLGIENILDNRYRPYSSGIVAAGRNVIFSIRGSF